MQPLTHHDILGLVEPFTRNSCQLDLAASDRSLRRLTFKPRTFRGSALTTTPSGSAPSTAPGDVRVFSDLLTLDCSEDDLFVLKRSVICADGLAAALVIKGADAASLLADVEAVDPPTLFKSGEGWQMACSYRLKPGRSTSQSTSATPQPQPPPQPRTPAMLLTHAVVQVGGLTLQLKMPAVTGYPAELELTAHAAIDLPDDLLQVLGRNWSRLTRAAKSWKGTLQIHGKEPTRTRLAQDQMAAAARHLALTLSQPPAAFARQQAAARWRVAARRALPMLTLVALLLGSLAVPYLGIAQDSVYWMLIFNAPPLLLLWGFSLREMPRFELPRSPRPLTAQSWWPAAADVPQSQPSGQVGAGVPHVLNQKA